MKPISADSHVVESEAVFVGLIERFGDDAPRVMNAGTIDDAIVIPSKGRRGIRKRMGWAGMRTREGVDIDRRKGHKPEVDDLTDPAALAMLEKGYDGLRAGIRDGAYRGDDQDVDGVLAEFLYPGFFGLFSFENTELLVACQQNYNDWLYDYASAAEGRLYGLAVLPVQDPHAAAAELNRVLKMGYRGGCIPCSSPYGKPYQNPDYDPIWSLAEEAGFPLSMHVGTNSWRPRREAPYPEVRDSVVDYAGAASSIQRTLVELMCRGVAEAHPNLKFVVSEFNAGWIAHFLDRVDQGLQREERFRGSEFTGERPHDVWRRQFHATIEDDRPALLTREILGVETLMWGSDYPHVDSTWPFSIEVIEEVFADIPLDETQKITHDNVKALYGL